MLSYVAQIRNFIMLDNILTSYQSFIMLFHAFKERDILHIY